MRDLVALHGFTQRGSALVELESCLDIEVVAPDLPGHGSAPLRSWAEAVDGIAALAGDRPQAPVLLGYSMGGRLALGVAVEHPGSISGVVAVSASPGISDPAARDSRASADHRLADRIESVGVERFIDEWLARPMFVGLAARGSAWREADRGRRVSNSAGGLAGALRTLGQGAQPDLRPRLGAMTVPVLLVVGERDDRYHRVADEMAGLLPNVSTAVVGEAGHSVIGERPEQVAEAILRWAAG